ncbi:MAG: PQQ-binding-like beta-propeller repeat protein [Halorientalis sp.]
MRRRRVLALAAVGLAGCESRELPPPGTTAPPPLEYDDVARSTPTPREAPLAIEADAAWPQFAADAANTGWTPTLAGPTESPSVAWHQWTRGQPVATPVVAGRRLIVATDAPDEEEDDRGRVHAFHRATGETLWVRPVPGGVTMAPAVAAGRVHVLSVDGTVTTFALDGTQEWQRSVPAPAATTAPTVAGGRLVVLDTRGETVRVLDAASGEVVWQRSVPRPLTTPAVADGTIYLPAAQERVLALDLATGDREWEFLTGTYQPIRAAPAVGPDHVAVGLDYGPTTLVLDRASGDRVWGRESGGRPSSSPALTDETVVSADEEGAVVAHDLASGTERWRATGPPVVNSPPTVAGDTVFVARSGEDDLGREQARLDAISLAEGETRWTLTERGVPGGSVVGADGLAYAVFDSKRVVCLQ